MTKRAAENVCESVLVNQLLQKLSVKFRVFAGLILSGILNPLIQVEERDINIAVSLFNKVRFQCSTGPTTPGVSGVPDTTTFFLKAKSAFFIDIYWYILSLMSKVSLKILSSNQEKFIFPDYSGLIS